MTRPTILQAVVCVCLIWLIQPAEAQAQCVTKGYDYGTNKKGVDDFILDVFDPLYTDDVQDAADAWNACSGADTGNAPRFALSGWGAPVIEVNFSGVASPFCGGTDVDKNGGTIVVYLNGPSTCPDLLTTIIHELGHALGLDGAGESCTTHAMGTSGVTIHQPHPAECSWVEGAWQTQHELDNPGLNGGPDPLVLDLNGDGIVTSNPWFYPVEFDIDGDGDVELTGWTNERALDALLFMDLNGNKVADGGHELFGDSSTLPGGITASDGFAALAVYDQPEHGGNGDGVISRRDRVWSKLRLWVDTNHDAVSVRRETSSLGRRGLLSIDLVAGQGDGVDGAGNTRLLTGVFWVRGAGNTSVPHEITSVIFRTIE